LLIHTLSLRQIFFGSIATKARHNKNAPQTKTPSLKTHRSNCSHWNIGFSPAAILYDFVRSIVCGNAYGLILEHQFCQCNLCSALDLNLDWWTCLQLDWNLRSFLHSRFAVSLFCKRFYLMFFFPCDAVEPCVGVTFLIHFNGVVWEFRQI
jgi:hypothetical protein